MVWMIYGGVINTSYCILLKGVEGVAYLTFMNGTHGFLYIHIKDCGLWGVLKNSIFCSCVVRLGTISLKRVLKECPIWPM